MEKKKDNIIHLNADKKESAKKSIGYKLGALFAATCQMCLLAVIVALTTKFIIWLF